MFYRNNILRKVRYTYLHYNKVTWQRNEIITIEITTKVNKKDKYIDAVMKHLNW